MWTLAPNGEPPSWWVTDMGPIQKVRIAEAAPRSYWRGGISLVAVALGVLLAACRPDPLSPSHPANPPTLPTRPPGPSRHPGEPPTPRTNGAPETAPLTVSLGVACPTRHG